MKKTLGMLCHVSSIPSKYGIGDFGQSSRDFIDFLAERDFKIWQILPLNETNIWNCPYSSNCCFSIDPIFVDPDELLAQNKITPKDVEQLLKLQDSPTVNYTIIKEQKAKLFDIAFSNIDSKTQKAVESEFETSPWLYQYAYYKTLLDIFKVDDFRDVPKVYWKISSAKAKTFIKTNYKQILKYGYVQYLLDSQWQKVRAYAKKHGIKILGDLPIYPNPNSFDVFASPEQFKLDPETLMPTVYGGVPPDDFCADGQNWETCVYDWDYMQKHNYKYLIDKIKLLLNKYDILRLDHFLGYTEHFEWSVANPGTGEWYIKGGEDFFNTLQANCDMSRIVVEDLGLDKEEANRIKKMFDLKGMCLVQMTTIYDTTFRYFPDNVPANSLYYLRTHDNNTFIGYLSTLPQHLKADFCMLMDINYGTDQQILVDCIRRMMQCKSKIVIIQMQDFLMQDQDQRMNIPGQAENCWEYRAPNGYQGKVTQTINKVLHEKPLPCLTSKKNK